MAKHTREETKDLVAAVLRKDEVAENLFYHQYKGCIHDLTNKWWIPISRVSGGLYQYDDVYSEFWEIVYRKLPTYDWQRSNVVTWIYLMCTGRAGKILRSYNAIKRGKNEVFHVSLNDVFFSSGGEDDIEFIDRLADPNAAFDEKTVNDMELFEYIYILNEMLLKMNHAEKIVYLNRMRGMTQASIAKLIGRSQVQVSRIHSRILSFATQERAKFKHEYMNPQVVLNFAAHLLSKKEDEDLCDEYQYDLGSVKICREVLHLTHLYKKEEVEYAIH